MTEAAPTFDSTLAARARITTKPVCPLDAPIPNTFSRMWVDRYHQVRETLRHGNCSACGVTQNSPRMAKGKRHKACGVSPRGRFFLRRVRA